ncbi:MAG: hypothetical protein PF444_04575, partial [Bacteroidales bacterium]|nr:hypothetical protein [Bacteroidales bacterium]
MLKKIFLLILTGMLAFGCYDPLEIDTRNLNKVEIPVKFAAPLMDGQFTLEFDSFFNEEAIGGDLITYANGRAFFKYDTVFNFFDELSEFLTMADVDFSNVTSFREKFSLLIDMADVEIPYSDSIQYNT